MPMFHTMPDWVLATSLFVKIGAPERGGIVRETERSSIHWLTLQNQELLPNSPTQAPVPGSTIFPSTLAWSWVRSGTAEAQHGTHQRCWYCRQLLNPLAIRPNISLLFFKRTKNKFFLRLIYSIWKAVTGGDKESREISSFIWVTSPNDYNHWNWARLEPGTSCRSFMWGQEPKYLSHHPLLPQSHKQGTWLQPLWEITMERLVLGFILTHSWFLQEFLEGLAVTK